MMEIEPSTLAPLAQILGVWGSLGITLIWLGYKIVTKWLEHRKAQLTESQLKQGSEDLETVLALIEEDESDDAELSRRVNTLEILVSRLNESDDAELSRRIRELEFLVHRVKENLDTLIKEIDGDEGDA
jgi:hypothetical protein